MGLQVVNEGGHVLLPCKQSNQYDHFFTREQVRKIQAVVEFTYSHMLDAYLSGRIPHKASFGYSHNHFTAQSNEDSAPIEIVGVGCSNYVFDAIRDLETNGDILNYNPVKFNIQPRGYFNSTGRVPISEVSNRFSIVPVNKKGPFIDLQFLTELEFDVLRRAQ